MYRTIVFATDFSDCSEAAMDATIALAKEFHSKVHVVHAFHLATPMIGTYEVRLPDQYFEQIRGEALRQLQDTADKISAEGIDVEWQLSDVPAANSIQRAAEQNDADLIVMGTHGHTGLKHVMLGSVAERTIRIAPCSVLTAKSKE